MGVDFRPALMYVVVDYLYGLAAVLRFIGIFRMYNPYAGEHHYCMTESERDSLVGAGWIDEGIAWYGV